MWPAQRLERWIRRLTGRLGRARPPRWPRVVVWELTYACPLRCVHCYAEAGRHGSAALGLPELRRIAQRLEAIQPPPDVVLSGGEPTIVPGFLDLAARLREQGARVTLYTCGWHLEPDLAQEICRFCTRVGVSIDGADAETNDRIRGRQGALDEALNALDIFDSAIFELARQGKPRPELALEMSVLKSNQHQVDQVVSELAARFSHLSTLRIGVAMPEGFASRESFASTELLNDQEIDRLCAAQPRLQRLVRPGQQVKVLDNRIYQLTPEQVRRGQAADYQLKIEPDGSVRGLDPYEGRVGNLVEEELGPLWSRAIARLSDPFVVAQLESVRTMEDWAEATRRIDEHFADPETRRRIQQRQ